MKTHPLLILVAAFTSLFASVGHAQIFRQLVTVQMTGLTQSTNTTVSGAVTNYSVVSFKVLTKNILALVATNTAATFPAGSVLVLENFDQFAVYSGDPARGGTNILSIDPGLLGYDYSAFPIKGKGSSTSFNFNYYFITRINFDDSIGLGQGDAFNFQGYTTEKNSGNDFMGTFSDAWTSSGNADGFLAGNIAVLNGKVSAKGKIP